MTTKLQMANLIMDANPWVSEDERNNGISILMKESKNAIADKLRSLEELKGKCKDMNIEWPAKSFKEYIGILEKIYGGYYSYEQIIALTCNRNIIAVGGDTNGRN